MTSYTDIFGGGAVPPGRNSYQTIALMADRELAWNDLADAGESVVSDILHVNNSYNDPALSLKLPPGNEGAVGSSILIRSVGSDPFVLKDNQGGTICVVAVGEARFVYLTGNSTVAGTWSVVTFGVGTSSADSSALAGYGLLATGSTLSQSMPVVELTNNHTVTESNRGTMFVFTGGGAKLSLPAVGGNAAGVGFFIGVRNAGTGTIIVDGDGSEPVDGASTLDLSPGESTLLVAGDGVWFSVGYGRSNTFLYSKLVKSVAGGANVTLSAAEAANQMMVFTGVLTANINVIVPAVSSIYYIYNSTTGAYTLTVKTAAGTGVAVEQARRAILTCDGTNVYLAQDSGLGQVGTLGDGSEGAPSLTFTSDANTGMFRKGDDIIGFTAGGTERLSLSTSALTLSTTRMLVPTGSVGSPSYSFAAEGASGWYRVGAGEIGLSVGSTLVFSATSTAVKAKDSIFTLQDEADATKQAKFQCSGITAGQTRTYTFPNGSDTLVGTTLSQTLTNKTISGGTVLPAVLSLPNGNAPTLEADVQWDYTAELLRVGTGSDTKTMVDTNSTQTLTNKTISSTAAASGLTMSTSRLLGRTTAGSGAIQEIQVSGALTLSAGYLSCPSYLTYYKGSTYKNSGFSVILADNGKLFECNGTFTVTLPALGTVDTDFWVTIVNAGTGTITLSAASLEYIMGPGFTTAGVSSVTLPYSGTTTGPYNCSGITLYVTKGGIGGGDYWGTSSVRETHGAQVFTADGTWACPDGVTTAWISGAGGGGAGGGYGAAAYGGGGGGGGGQSAFRTRVSVVPGTAYTVTVGEGGTGVSGAGGNNGEASSVGALLTLAGGTGGGVGTAGQWVFGSGGAAGGAGGGTGGMGLGWDFAGSGNGAKGGDGGGTVFAAPRAGGATGTTGQQAAGTVGCVYGGGGTGGYGVNGTATAGGNGANGIIIIEW